MADTAIIGKVGVKVIPDTKDFKRTAQAALDKVEKQLNPIKVTFDFDTTSLSARVDAIKEDIESSLNDLKATIKPDLDEKDKEDVQHKLDGLEAKADVKIGEVSERTALARLSLIARTRVVDLLPEVNKAFAAKAALTLSALSGGRSIGNIGEEVTEFVGGLDKSIPKFSAIALGIANIGSSLLSTTSNLLSFSGSLASIAPAALALPGIFGGLAIGVTASFIAFKDFGNELPGTLSKLKSLKGVIDSNFWTEAKAPIKDLVDTLLPQFSAGMARTSTELGGFFGKLATSLGGVFNHELTSMFANLAKSIKITSGFTDDFAGILRSLGSVGAGELPKLATFFGNISHQFNDFLNKAQKTNALQGWVDTGVEALKDLGSVIASTSSTLAGLAKASLAGGSSSLQTLAATLKSVSRTVNSADFQKTLTGVFQSAHDALHALATQSGPEFKSFVDRLADTLTHVLPKAGATAGDALGAIFSALDQPNVEKSVVGFFTNLQGVVKTLAPAMKPLANALAAVVDVIGDIGTNIGRGLAPLIEGLSPDIVDLAKHLGPLTDTLGDLLVNLVQIGVKGLPNISGLADAVNALLSPLVPLTAAIGKIPGPILQFATSAGILAITLPKVNAAIDTGVTKFKAWGTTLGTAAGQTKLLGSAARVAAGAAGLAALTTTAGSSNKAVRVLGATAGDALLGFSAGGPIGAAIGGGIGLLTSLGGAFHSSAKDAAALKEKTQGYVGTLDDLTGATQRATRAQAEKNLVDSGALAAGAKLGLSARTLVNAALGNADAQRQVASATKPVISNFEKQSKAFSDATDRSKTYTQANIDSLKTNGDLARGAQLVQTAVGSEAKAIRDAGRDVRTTASAVDAYSKLFKGLPKQAITQIKALGTDATIKQVAKLTAKYNLTPKQISTLIRVTGAPATEKQIAQISDALQLVGKANPDLKPYINSLLSQLNSGTNQAKSNAHSGGVQIGQSVNSGVQAGVSGLASELAAKAAAAVRAAVAAAQSAVPHTGGKTQSGTGAGISPKFLSPQEQADYYQHGARIAQRVLAGLQSKLSQIKSLFSQSIKAGNAADDKALHDWFDSQHKALTQLASTFKQNMAQLDKAKAKLTALTQAMKDFKAATIASIVGSGDPTQTGATTFQGVTSGLEGSVQQAKALQKVLKQLLKEGLNKTTLKQILAAGPTAGLATAQAIQSAGKAGVDQVNKLEKQLQDAANQIGKSTANAIYHSDIKKATADLLDLEKTVTQLQARLEKSIQKMIDRLIKVLKANKSKVAKAKADALAEKKKKDDGGSGSGSGTGPISGHASNSRAAAQTADKIVNNYKTLNYYAADGSSLGSEEDLFAAAGRARMVGF